MKILHDTIYIVYMVGSNKLNIFCFLISIEPVHLYLQELYQNKFLLGFHYFCFYVKEFLNKENGIIFRIYFKLRSINRLQKGFI